MELQSPQRSAVVSQSKNAQKKTRLDVELVHRGLAPSREKAQALILAGQVLVDEVPVDKAGTSITPESVIRIRGVGGRFVSRGGDKIDSIFDHFEIQLEGKVALDVGASTGGFTDAMLQRDVAIVYAVDVGFNQLDHKLRTDTRVVVMEKTHAKDLVVEMFPEAPSFATIDVSFIGVSKILSFVISVLNRPAELLILVKPQFELEPEFVSKGGVVRLEEHQQLAIKKVSQVAEKLGAKIIGSCEAALKGAKQGNQEYFLYIQLP